MSEDSKTYSIYSNSDFVDKYFESIQHNAWNAYYERPSSLSLLPDITNKRILDAGCGPGIVSKILRERGALVTSVDYSPAMVDVAKKVLGETGDIKCMDLNLGLPNFDDKAFDIIYCSLTIHYIDDLEFLFKEFCRVLRKGGVLIFSTDHPDSPAFKDSPITAKRVNDVVWENFGITLRVIERPWGDILSSLEKANLRIEKIIDAEPTEQCRFYFPQTYQYLKENRHFICLRATKSEFPLVHD